MGIPHLSSFSTVYILAHLPLIKTSLHYPTQKWISSRKAQTCSTRTRRVEALNNKTQARLAVLLLRRRDRLVDRLLVDQIMVIRHSVSSPRRQDITSTPAPAKRSPMVRVACTRSRLGTSLLSPTPTPSSPIGQYPVRTSLSSPLRSVEMRERIKPTHNLIPCVVYRSKVDSKYSN